MKNKVNIVLLLTFAIFFSACESSYYKENQKIPDAIWNMNNHLKFEANIEDASKNFDISINIRHSQHYPASNLWLYIRTTSPSGGFQQDTLECILADQDYKWKGSGMGDIWDINIPFKYFVKFAEAGTYQFEIEHGMRMENLPQVMAVGVQIDEVE